MNRITTHSLRPVSQVPSNSVANSVKLSRLELNFLHCVPYMKYAELFLASAQAENQMSNLKSGGVLVDFIIF